MSIARKLPTESIDFSSPSKPTASSSSPQRQYNLEGRVKGLEEAELAAWLPYAHLRSPPSVDKVAAEQSKPLKDVEADGGETKEEKASGKHVKPWLLDTMTNREGLPDLLLDDSRYIAAPNWKRAELLKELAIHGERGDAKLIDVGKHFLHDPEGMVRAAALRLLAKVTTRGDKSVVHDVLRLTKDAASKVRMEACNTIREIGSRGTPASSIAVPTGTAADVKLLNRDEASIKALMPLVDDDMGYVRVAAVEALDVINSGWQRFEFNENRRDDAKMLSQRRQPPVPSPVKAKVPELEDVLQRKSFLPDVQAGAAKKLDFGSRKAAGPEQGAGRRAGRSTLAGYKYSWYNDELRQERSVKLFEEAQEKASLQRKHTVHEVTEPGSRSVTTEWMGIEWVDRTKREYFGKVIHPLGAGVDPTRDVVPAPYNAGYNGFTTPLGYNYM
ncbi:hypothetical protein GUITHDRAFT_106056 [Guillardia theta CCMP2712]|uniref:TOG domain-containing protein n=1 Tax=Guillardia theta (strain CCMP2712) TaxID=905079 RepID=L1JI28_GUITC|nr:hypothetical protein GUITHDRAFT_106056 [Guillardia theta CCMP2712]EKX47972.1 hypothetical protein GUITHDRAFT_106056 [Guillardia theta CCMP2712]|mmetsp:Transcript_46444/g.145658  ORF Transcript_46444/g.145658 Transcript_46444/m.145658 type:complete len:443 (-) Transcript_46444:1209-2537(-)|eukprot:XP_005834952.1 hypothetical protein GUITHDRAFT_106056 [Guillardia theta CCMP2712]